MPEQQERWHLDKRVQVSHIVATAVAVISVVVYINKIDQRVAVVETQIISQKERDERQDRYQAEMQKLMYEQLTKIDEKLNRLIERQNVR
jgi:predicted Holliday junction resolvase-like endonuclease